MSASSKTALLAYYGLPLLQRVFQPSIGGSQPVEANYSYVENSTRIGQISFWAETTPVMNTTVQHDDYGRVTNISSTASAVLSSYSYRYNAAGQRDRVDISGSNYAFPSCWQYGYDSLGQVTGGSRRFADDTLVAGQQFGYTFDDIGNRIYTTTGGGETGLEPRYSRYSVNGLNQYRSRTTPSFTTVMGTAHSDAAVTLLDSTGSHTRALRQEEHFYGELPVDNVSTPVWLSITNFAVLNTGTEQVVTNKAGSVLIPPTPQQYAHDDRGNLVSDGLWSRIWNLENRMTRIESASGVPAQVRKREDWKYLSDGRWIERIISTNNGSAYYPALTNRFVWDGKVLLAVLDHTNGLVMSFMRGSDLSGSIEGAGGVGGVLAVNFAPSTLNPQPSTHLVSYDGNGNVVALTDAATGESTAVYEYGPFGELLRATGPMAQIMHLRFSTMFADDVTRDAKYLFRDYRAVEGRWTSRDSIAEKGGLNLYACTTNNLVNYIDVLGRCSLPPRICCPGARDLPCDQVCRKACSNFSLNGYFAYGGVVCNNGQACPCICGDPVNGWTIGLCPEIDSIIMDHENQHVKKTWCHTCGMFAAGPEDLPCTDFKQEECEQRRISLSSLNAILPSMSEGRCRDVAIGIVKMLDNFISKNCR